MLEGGRIVQTGGPADIVLRPADAYVAEFVQHMNPLSVLTGRMVMRHWGDLTQDAGQRWLDDSRVHAVQANGDGSPRSVRVGDRSLPLRAVKDGLDDGAGDGGQLDRLHL